jgi:hypothetical protein
MSAMRKKLKSAILDTENAIAYAANSCPSLTDEMSARLRRFHHAVVEVSGTYVSRRHALHMLLDAGMKSLGNDVIRAAKASA